MPHFSFCLCRKFFLLWRVHSPSSNNRTAFGRIWGVLEKMVVKFRGRTMALPARHRHHFLYGFPIYRWKLIRWLHRRWASVGLISMAVILWFDAWPTGLMSGGQWWCFRAEMSLLRVLMSWCHHCSCLFLSVSCGRSQVYQTSLNRIHKVAIVPFAVVWRLAFNVWAGVFLANMVFQEVPGASGWWFVLWQFSIRTNTLGTIYLKATWVFLVEIVELDIKVKVGHHGFSDR